MMMLYKQNIPQYYMDKQTTTSGHCSMWHNAVLYLEQWQFKTGLTLIGVIKFRNR